MSPRLRNGAAAAGRRLRYAAVVVLAAGLGVSACGGWTGPSGQQRGVVAADAGRVFLDRYTEPDGRVVRRDQGGDTASEGQAYALLVAGATGDRSRFLAVWNWTRTHLQRPDGLLAWRWADGHVADANPAADADADAAAALVAAGQRFSLPALRADGLRLAGAVLTHETAEVAGRLVLLPGPWAAADPVVNPSYFDPCRWLRLADATGDGRWRRMAADALAIVGQLEQGDRLPPDWARLGPEGGATASTAPGASGAAPRYGLDAVRLPVRLAAPCPAGNDGPRDRAAALWPRLRRLADDGAGLAYGLDGTPLDTLENPAGLVGAAAAASAAGDAPAADRLLQRAADLDRRVPTYYGAAWLALENVFRSGAQERRTAGVAAGALPLQLIASHGPAGDTTSTTAPADGTTSTTAPAATPPTTSPPTTSPTTTSSSTTSSSTSSSSTSSSSTTSSTPSSSTTSSSPTSSSTTPSTTATTAPTSTTTRSQPTSSTTAPASAATSRSPSTTNPTPPAASDPALPTTTPGSGAPPTASARSPLAARPGASDPGTSAGTAPTDRLSQPAPQADRLLPPAPERPGPAVRPPVAARLRRGFLLAGLALATAMGLTSGLHDRATRLGT